MPCDTVNDDGFLELITTGHNKLIRDAFVSSACVDSFRDWRGRYVRILAGQKQLERRYSELIPAGDAVPKTTKEEEKSKKTRQAGDESYGICAILITKPDILAVWESE